MNAVCPTPGKILYLSRGEARVAVRHTRPGLKGQLRPYWCPACGGWHLTSMTGRASRQARKRLRQHRVAA